MSATSFQVQTLVFADPSLTTNAKQEFEQVNSSIAFTSFQNAGIVTLSTNTAVAGSQIDGLLYVPDLSPSDPCANSSAPYVPSNVTRQSDLPSTAYNTIAIAPWISAQCTQNYLASARGDPTSAFLFFLPNQNNASPPTANNAAWSLNDGGQWKIQNEFPVYAISSASASMLLQASAQYSGNMTSVPYGADLVKVYDPTDYVRLALGVNTASSSGLPSLWIFLLIIVAILITIVGLTSLAMHLMQRRRRESLRRRVAAGEVNLETLGIKRLTVPERLLNEMPLYTYDQGIADHDISVASNQARQQSPKESLDAELEEKHPSSSVATVPNSEQKAPQRSHFDQPTCAICLDDFEPGVSTVRQLPCEHIFHSDCVDTFLRDNSSLCPLCKVSVLPKGYCPAVITNAMVRRERLLRRIRPSDERVNSVASNDADGPSSLIGRLLSRFQRRLPQNSDVELGTRNAIEPRVSVSRSQPARQVVDTTVEEPGPAPPARQVHARREWARRRALALLGPRPTPDLQTEVSQPHSSRWRKWLYGVFPAIA